MEKKKYAAYGMLLAGTALLAVGVQNFLEPMELVAGWDFWSGDDSG